MRREECAKEMQTLLMDRKGKDNGQEFTRNAMAVILNAKTLYSSTLIETKAIDYHLSISDKRQHR